MLSTPGERRAADGGPADGTLPRALGGQEGVALLDWGGQDVAPTRGRADVVDLEDVLRQAGCREAPREAVRRALGEAVRCERRGAAREGEGGLAKGRVRDGNHGSSMRMSIRFVEVCFCLCEMCSSGILWSELSVVLSSSFAHVMF